jgi:hypothetical protein
MSRRVGWAEKVGADFMSIPKRRDQELDIVLHSDYPPDTCLKRLADEMGVDNWTPFSLSGYEGNAAMLGRIAGHEFRLHKRKRGHNTFAPILFGHVLPEGHGAVIEGYWGVWPGMRLFAGVWIGLAILIGAPIFISALMQAVRKGFMDVSDWWIGLIVPPALVAWGLILPRLGAAVSDYEKNSIEEFLHRVLVANRRSEPTAKRNWHSTLDHI